MNDLEETKYSKWYYEIINKRKCTTFDGYGENHHIIPKSLGGSDDNDNIVRLTAREHFVCHLLLTKMFPTDKYKTSKMVRAWCWMSWTKSNERDYKINSRLFEKLRIKFSSIISENQTINNSQKNTKWIYNESIKSCMKINTTDPIPDGWTLGRVINWDKFLLVKEPSPTLFCIFCGNELSGRKKRFCSRTCMNSYGYKTSDLIKICKGDKVKDVKTTNFPAYQACGWVKSSVTLERSCSSN